MPPTQILLVVAEQDGAYPMADGFYVYQNGVYYVGLNLSDKNDWRQYLKLARVIKPA